MTKKFLIGLLGLLLSGCAGQYLTSSRNFSEQKKSYDKIVVIGVSKSRAARAAFEEEVANGLKEHGVDAVSSLRSGVLIPMEGPVSDSETARLNEQLLDAGFDGAIVTHLVNTSEYTDVIPGISYTSYYPVRYGRFGRYVSYYPVQNWEPDRVVSGTRYVLESTLYALDNGTKDNLQWVGMFELTNPGNIDKVSSKYARELTEALLKESIASPME